MFSIAPSWRDRKKDTGLYMIYSFQYHHTNCFFVSNEDESEYLAFDCGWPCTYYEYLKNLKEVRLDKDKIKFLIVSHFHLDHAGLFGQFQKSNLECVVFDFQIPFIDSMEKIIRKNAEYELYEEIDKCNLSTESVADFNTLIKSHGFKGHVESLNGHSEDSIGYFADEKIVLIGDLAPISQIMNEDINGNENWERILGFGAKLALPSHANQIVL